MFVVCCLDLVTGKFVSRGRFKRTKQIGDNFVRKRYAPTFTGNRWQSLFSARKQPPGNPRLNCQPILRAHCNSLRDIEQLFYISLVPASRPGSVQPHAVSRSPQILEVSHTQVLGQNIPGALHSCHGWFEIRGIGLMEQPTPEPPVGPLHQAREHTIPLFIFGFWTIPLGEIAPVLSDDQPSLSRGVTF